MFSSDGAVRKGKGASESRNSARAATRKTTGNRLLATLPEASRRTLSKGLQEIELGPREFVHRRNAPITHAYFPADGLISLVMPSNGKSVEIAMVGDEGFFGLPLFLGTDRCPMTALSQVEGHGFLMEAEFFRAQARTNSPFAEALGRYAQAFIVMLAQGLVCSHAHIMEQRCARWLLMARDRLHADDFRMTQEFFAEMLGVRRSTVSEVAAKLYARKLIRYSRGKMKIIDREGLERLACSCYRVIRRELDWALEVRPCPERST